MNDKLIGAMVPICIYFALWAGRQFVRENVGPRGPKGDKGDVGLKMSVRDFREFVECIKVELNGRYMLAIETREQFKQVHDRLISLEVKLDNVVIHEAKENV